MIDTNKVRAETTAFNHCKLRDVRALCDALDEARAERDARMRVVELQREAVTVATERAEKAEAAIERVRALHAPISWHEECISSARHGWCLVKPDDHFYVGDDGIETCASNRLPDVCGHCTPEYDGHELRVNWPCPTLVALDDPS